MTETLGPLNLKIERLQQRLNVLTLRAVMGRTYPDFHKALQRDLSAARRQIAQLTNLHISLSRQLGRTES